MQSPESTGGESILAELRESIGDDDHLLALAGGDFDDLLVTFEKAKDAT